MHYLVTLAKHLPTSLGPTKRSFVKLPGSQGYALELRANDESKDGLATVKGAVIRIRVVWPANAFQANKLQPSGNLARPKSIGDNQQVDPATLPATPLRSTSMHLSSLSILTAHLQYHHNLTKTYPSYASAARLLQLWTQKRSYGAQLGLTDDWWAWCVAQTLTSVASAAEPASAAVGGEAWAIWRKTVEWLAHANWTEGVFLRNEGQPTYSKDEFKKAFAGRPVFVDPTGTVNLAAGIDLAMLEMVRYQCSVFGGTMLINPSQLKQDAKTTIAFMLSPVEDDAKFDAAFVRKLVEVERFDNFAR